MKNDKLQEIEEQCWIETTPIRSYLNREKFAELIIKACIEYCGEDLSKTVGGAMLVHFGIDK
jgi:hypothetical protein